MLWNLFGKTDTEKKDPNLEELPDLKDKTPYAKEVRTLEPNSGFSECVSPNVIPEKDLEERRSKHHQTKKYSLYSGKQNLDSAKTSHRSSNDSERMLTISVPPNQKLRQRQQQLSVLTNSSENLPVLGASLESVRNKAGKSMLSASFEQESASKKAPIDRKETRRYSQDLTMSTLSQEKGKNEVAPSRFKLKHHTSIDFTAKSSPLVSSQTENKESDSAVPTFTESDGQKPTVLDTEQPLDGSNKIESSGTAIWFPKHHVRASIWKTFARLTYYQIAVMIISLITAVAANDYRQSTVIDGEHYQIWGHYLIDGLITAIFIGWCFRMMVRNEEKDSSVVRYRIPWKVTLATVLLCCLFSVGFNSIFETQTYGQSRWWYLACKVFLLPLTSIVYFIYLRAKKLSHLKKSQVDKGMFLKNNIYKRFLEELNERRMELMEKQKRRKRSRATGAFEVQIGEHRHFRELSNLFKFNKVQYLKVIPIRRGLALHVIIGLFFLQLFVSYGFLKAIDRAYESQEMYGLYLAAFFYPATIGLLKLIIMKINEIEEFPFTVASIHLISMAFAALPYRLIYLRSQNYEQAVGVIAIKFLYKLVVYVAYGSAFTTLNKIFAKTAECLQRTWEFILKNILRRATTPKLPKMETQEPLSIISKISSGKDLNPEETRLKEYICRFITLEIIDITSLIAVMITFAVYSLQTHILHVFQSFANERVKEIIGYNMIELVFDLLILVPMLALFYWKRTTFYLPTVKKYFNELVRGSFGLFVVVSLFIYYTQYMVISNSWSE